MTERDVKGLVTALVGAIIANDEKTALQVGVTLVTQVLVDLNRIANALEVIAIERRSK